MVKNGQKQDAYQKTSRGKDAKSRTDDHYGKRNKQEQGHEIKKIKQGSVIEKPN